MTEQRRVIARVLSDRADHPDVEQVYRRAVAIDPHISIATVYRTVRLFEEANILERHDFGDGRSRYEEMPSDHHDHLIDLQSGRVIEFRTRRSRSCSASVAEKLGYELVGHRLELYAVPQRARPAPRSDRRGRPRVMRRSPRSAIDGPVAGRASASAISSCALAEIAGRDRRGAGAALSHLLRGDGGRSRPPRWRPQRRDFDSFDPICDHLLVLDHSHGGGAASVVGTYRLLRRVGGAEARPLLFGRTNTTSRRCWPIPARSSSSAAPASMPDYRSRAGDAAAVARHRRLCVASRASR